MAGKGSGSTATGSNIIDDFIHYDNGRLNFRTEIFEEDALHDAKGNKVDDFTILGGGVKAGPVRGHFHISVDDDSLNVGIGVGIYGFAETVVSINRQAERIETTDSNAGVGAGIGAVVEFMGTKTGFELAAEANALDGVQTYFTLASGNHGSTTTIQLQWDDVNSSGMPQRGSSVPDPLGIFTDNNGVQQTMYTDEDGNRRGNLPYGEDSRNGYDYGYGYDPRGAGGNWGYNAPTREEDDGDRSFTSRTVSERSDGTTVTQTTYSDSDNRTTQTREDRADGSSTTTTNYSNGSSTRTDSNRDGNGTHTATTSNGSSVTYTQSNYGADMPLILDLSGSGIEITELSQSTVFMDASGDGLLNRTAWAAEGNGVLFYDPDNTGEISEKRQYVFTEWDPTATSDMEALRSVLGSNVRPRPPPLMTGGSENRVPSSGSGNQRLRLTRQGRKIPTGAARSGQREETRKTDHAQNIRRPSFRALVCAGRSALHGAPFACAPNGARRRGLGRQARHRDHQHMV